MSLLGAQEPQIRNPRASRVYKARRAAARTWLLPTIGLSLLVAACGTAAVGSDPVSVVQGYYDVISDQRLDYAMELIAEGAVFISPDGQIVFDGTRGAWTLECNRDASQVFCAGN